MVRHRLVIGGLVGGLALLAGCASDAGDTAATPSAPSPGGATASASGSAAPGSGGNGSIYVSSTTEGSKVITRYPIAADGSLGSPIEVVNEAADAETFPAVVDGLGNSLLTGTFTEYWTTEVQQRDATTGAVSTTVPGKRWCGGEGLTYNACVLLDDATLARTSELGGEGLREGTIDLTALADGSTTKTLGPYEGLSSVLGSGDPNVLFLTISTEPQVDPPEPQPGTVQRLDVSTGTATELGSYPTGWYPICPIGTDSVLGYPPDGSGAPSVVGPATIGELSWDDKDTPLGCSADGRYLYLQQIPQPPTETEDDTTPPNPSTSIDRITVADGTRTPVATLDPGVWAEQVTR
jgi:hypothetical protein